MKQGVGFRLLAALLVYTNIFWPTAILAETTKAAGVVASLTGQVTVARAAGPEQPAPLKFKDEVFFKDRISTKEQSIARVLMGGKALITIRELSDLTISEEPGKPSLVDLAKGKIGLAVARARMSPGESIEVRTPNAVAAVRGTVIVVEVIPAAGAADATPDYRPVRTSFTGQATPVQAPSFMTNFHVLKGTIEVSALGKPGSPPVSIGAGLSVTVAGDNVGQPVTSPPVQQLVKGLKTDPQLTGQGDAGSEAAKLNNVLQALGLGGGVTPPPPVVTNPSNLIQGCPPFCVTPPPQPPTGAPVVTFSGFSPSITLNAPLGSIQAGATTVGPAPLSFPTADIPGPDVTIQPISGEGVGPGQVLVPGNGGQLTTPYFATSAPNETVVLSGGIGLTNSHIAGGGSSNVFEVSGANAVIAGSALILQNSSIAGGVEEDPANTIIQISNGSLTGISSNALVTLDSGSSISAQQLISVAPVGEEGSATGLVLVGPALSSNGGSVTTTGDLIAVANNGFLGVTSGLALVNLSGGSLSASSVLGIYGGTVELGGSALLAQSGAVITTSGDLIFVDGVSAGPGSLMTDANLPLVNVSGSSMLSISGSLLNVPSSGDNVVLAGPLLQAANSDVTVTSDLISVGSVGSGASLSSTSSSPLVQFTGGSLTLGAGFLNASGATINLSGGLFSANGTTLHPSTSALITLTSSSLTVGGPLLDLTNSSLILGPTQPIASFFAGSSLTVSSGPVFKISGGSLTAQYLVNTDGAGNSFSLTGSLLDLTNTTVTLEGIANTIHGDTNILSFNLANGQPFIKMANSSLTLTGSDNLVEFGSNNGPVINQNGVALIATNSGTAQRTLSDEGPAININGPVLKLKNVNLTDTNTQIQLSNMAVNTNGSSLVEVVGPFVALTGPLLSATNGSFVTVGEVISVEPNVFLTSTSTGALISLDNSHLTVGNGPFVNVAGGSLFTTQGSLFNLASGSTMNIATGPLVAVSGGSIFAVGGTSLGTVGSGNTLSFTTPPPCSGNCVQIGSYNVLLSNGALPINLIVNPAFTPFSGTGSVTGLTSGPSGTALLSLDGPTSLMVLGPAFTPGAALSTVDSATGTVFLSTHLGVIDNGGPNPMVTTQSCSQGGCSDISVLYQAQDGSGQGVRLTGGLSITNSSIDASSEFHYNVFEVLIARAVIQGSLLSLSDSDISNAGSLLFISSGSNLTAVSTAPLVSLSGSSILPGETAEAAAVVTVNSGGTLVLTPGSGSLVAATNSTIAADTILDASGTVISMTSNPLITLTNTPVTSTITEFGGVVDVDGYLTLAGPLLSASGSATIITTVDTVVDVDGTVISTTTSPLISLTDSTVNSARVLWLGGSMFLAGPLLAASNTTFNLTGNMLDVLTGATLSSSTTQPLVQLTGGSLNLGLGGSFLSADGATITLAGGLFQATGTTINANGSSVPFVGINGGTLTVAGDVVNVAIPSSGAGGLIVNGSQPVVSISGGNTHYLADTPAHTSTTSAILNLSGTRTAPLSVPVDDSTNVSMTLGTDSPVRDEGEGGALPVAMPLFQASGATVNTNQAVRIDTALLEATAPIVNLINSTMNSNSDLVNLVQKANVVGTVVGTFPFDALVSLNNSTLNVNGSVFNVAGGSYLNVTGNLVSLNNGSTLNITNGGLVTVSGGSVFSLTGSLVNFGTGTNALNITTNVNCSGCSLVTTIPNYIGFPVLLENGATAAHVSVSPSFHPVSGTGTITLNGAAVSGPLLVLNGASSRIRLRPSP